jgi:hypothetical protein
MEMILIGLSVAINFGLIIYIIFDKYNFKDVDKLDDKLTMIEHRKITIVNKVLNKDYNNDKKVEVINRIMGDHFLS